MANQKPVLIEIVPYKDEWCQDFRSIAAALRAAAGELALRIDHIGSTSVPGLAAKDRIDVQITVLKPEHFDEMRIKLELLGYEMAPGVVTDHVPPWGPFESFHWEKRFFRPPANQRATNLHVRVDGRCNQRYPLLFRDYLRQHQHMALAYAEVKRRLAQYHGDDSEAYCDIKDPVCDIIADYAERWAQEVCWQPGAPDM